VLLNCATPLGEFVGYTSIHHRPKSAGEKGGGEFMRAPEHLHAVNQVRGHHTEFAFRAQLPHALVRVSTHESAAVPGPLGSVWRRARSTLRVQLMVEEVAPSTRLLGIRRRPTLPHVGVVQLMYDHRHLRSPKATYVKIARKLPSDGAL